MRPRWCCKGRGARSTRSGRRIAIEDHSGDGLGDRGLDARRLNVGNPTLPSTCDRQSGGPGDFPSLTAGSFRARQQHRRDHGGAGHRAPPHPSGACRPGRRLRAPARGHTLLHAAWSRQDSSSAFKRSGIAGWGRLRPGLSATCQRCSIAPVGPSFTPARGVLRPSSCSGRRPAVASAAMPTGSSAGSCPATVGRRPFEFPILRRAHRVDANTPQAIFAALEEAGRPKPTGLQPTDTLRRYSS